MSFRSGELSVRSVIQKGSTTFYWASLLFSDSVRKNAWLLYRWCRVCDDIADDPDEARHQQGLAALKLMTQVYFSVDAKNTDKIESERQGMLLGSHSTDSDLQKIFSEMRELCLTKRIPFRFVLDLIEGLGSDFSGRIINDQAELDRYCYQVAGTVGGIMGFIMDQTDSRASLYAVEMGKAMQLTNICRDIHEDFRVYSRVYLPSLSEDLVRTSDSFKNEVDHCELDKKIYAIRDFHLSRAEALYRSSFAGLGYLPVRNAFTVFVAACLYREIGRQILRSKRNEWRRRAVVSAFSKIKIFIFCVFDFPFIYIKSLRMSYERE